MLQNTGQRSAQRRGFARHCQVFEDVKCAIDRCAREGGVMRRAPAEAPAHPTGPAMPVSTVPAAQARVRVQVENHAVGRHRQSVYPGRNAGHKAQFSRSSLPPLQHKASPPCPSPPLAAQHSWESNPGRHTQPPQAGKKRSPATRSTRWLSGERLSSLENYGTIEENHSSLAHLQFVAFGICSMRHGFIVLPIVCIAFSARQIGDHESLLRQL